MANKLGKQLLELIQKQMPDFYAELEKKAEYPDQDALSPADYDDEVDNAELKALADAIEAGEFWDE